MNISQQQPQQSVPQKHTESILVVSREQLFAKYDAWHGIEKHNINEFISCIQTHQEYHPRYLMETNPRYKQIIPYIIFTHNNNYFLMQRAEKASEARLKSKYTLGIGGHMRKEDMTGSTLFDWARREFYEEVYYSGEITSFEVLGIINDDTNEVGQVHLGIALLAHGNSSDIRVKSELAHGVLASKEECQTLFNSMEGWSQFAFKALQN